MNKRQKIHEESSSLRQTMDLFGLIPGTDVEVKWHLYLEVDGDGDGDDTESRAPLSLKHIPNITQSGYHWVHAKYLGPSGRCYINPYDENDIKEEQPISTILFDDDTTPSDVCISGPNEMYNIEECQMLAWRLPGSDYDVEYSDNESLSDDDGDEEVEFVFINNDEIKEQIETVVSEILTDSLESTGDEGASLVNSLCFTSQMYLGREINIFRNFLVKRFHELLNERFANQSKGAIETLSDQDIITIRDNVKEDMKNEKTTV